MSERFFQISYHLPYLHIYIIAILACFYGILVLHQRKQNSTTKTINDFTIKTKYIFFIVNQIVLGISMLLPFFLAGEGKFIFDEWIDDNFFSAYPSGLILILTFLSMMYIYEKLADVKKIADFYCGLYFALLGLLLICISQQIVYIFLGLAVSTLAIYLILASDIDNTDKDQNSFSALLVYFIIGSISLLMLAIGCSWLYGATGSTLTFEFHDLITKDKNAFRPFLEIGTIFIIIAISLQFGLVPFHQWVIKLYQQASYPVAMIVMNITKIGIFSLTMRLIITSLFSVAETWKWMILIIAICSIGYGFIAMLTINQSFRKFLAYSSIANLGFVMLALFAVVEIRAGGELIANNAINAISSDLYYLIFYQFTNIAVFAFAWVIAKNSQDSDDINHFKGLAQRYPWFAIMMTTLMLSMAGIPPFLGFWARIAVIQALISANHQLLITIAMLFSLIGTFVYLRFIKMMYFDKPVSGHEDKINLAKPFRLVLSLHCLLFVGLGLFPAVSIQTAFLIMQ